MVGNVLLEQGKLEEALKAYRDLLAIAQRLSVADPSNAQWQRGLSIAYEKVGDVMVAQGKLDEALEAYRDDLAIVERLSAADSSNTWQPDLAIGHAKLALVYERQGRITDALQELILGRDIMAALVAIVPGNAQWKGNLAQFERDIARLQAQAGAQ